MLGVIGEIASLNIEQACKLNATARCFGAAAKAAIMRDLTASQGDRLLLDETLDLEDIYVSSSHDNARLSALHSHHPGTSNWHRVLQFFNANRPLGRLVWRLRVIGRPTPVNGTTNGLYRRGRLAFKPFPKQQLIALFNLFPRLQHLCLYDQSTAELPLIPMPSALRCIRFVGCEIDVEPTGKFLEGYPALEVNVSTRNIFARPMHADRSSVWPVSHLLFNISPFMEEIPFRIVAPDLRTLQVHMLASYLRGVAQDIFYKLVSSATRLETLQLYLCMCPTYILLNTISPFSADGGGKRHEAWVSHWPGAEAISSRHLLLRSTLR